MKNLICLVLGLTLSTIVYAAESFRTLSVPAKDLLEATRKIKSQTGPRYSVEGTLKCSQISREVPPYSVNSKCLVTVSGSTETVANPEKLIQALKKTKPMTGPAYSFKAKFSGTSISQEVPPYSVTESVDVILCQ